MDWFKKKILLLVVFFTGAAVLIVEIVAARILSPFFGNTIYTYSSIISVILAALSFGYYTGGILADRYPKEKILYSIIFLSGIFVLCIEMAVALVIQPLHREWSFVWGPLIASLILFFIPSFLMGTLSPFVIKLQGERFPHIGIGRISGETFFWSTLGSIAGSLMAGFVFIPHFGVDSIIISTGLLLCLVGLAGTYLYRPQKITFIIFAVLVFWSTLGAHLVLPMRVFSGTLYDREGLYERIVVYDGEYNHRPTRFLRNDLNNSSAMYLDSDEVVYEYSEYYKLFQLFQPDPKNILVLGAGAYSLPKAFLQAAPTAHIDVVEIEPTLYEVSKQFFNLPVTGRLTNYVGDARQFLMTSEKTYDIIFVDVFLSTHSLPVHCATAEFYRLLAPRIDADGIVFFNIIGDLYRGEKSILLSHMATIRSVFPQAEFFGVRKPEENTVQNVIALVAPAGQRLDYFHPRVAESDVAVIRELKDHVIDLEYYDLSKHVVFTDNYAPVEAYMAEFLKRYDQ